MRNHRASEAGRIFQAPPAPQLLPDDKPVRIFDDQGNEVKTKQIKKRVIPASAKIRDDLVRGGSLAVQRDRKTLR